MEHALPDLPATTSRSDRIPAVDALRGVAILGILLMNVTAYAMPYAAYVDPHAWGDDHGANAIVFRLDRVFVAGKMIGLLAMLFGAGFVLRGARATLAGHARRMLVLALIGLAHAYGLWYGDILFPYAIAGLIAFTLRDLPIDVLLVLGVCCLVLVVLLAFPIAGGGWDPADLAREMAAYRGTYAQQFAARWPMSLDAQTRGLIDYTLPEVVGLMLIGIALAKQGLLTSRASTRVCLTIAAIACPLGWGITGIDGLLADRAADPSRALALADAFEPVVAALLAVGYAALLMPLFRRRSPWPIIAVGRCALSCYLTQTVICTTLFYGYGFGRFGRVDRVHGLIVVAGVWLFLLIAAPLWLSVFTIGPMEWLWRALAWDRCRARASRPAETAAARQPA